MDWLLEKTIMSIVTVLLILATKKLMSKKANPIWHYYIWFILIAQLLLPALPYSSFSIKAVIPIDHIVTMVQAPQLSQLTSTNTSVTWQNIFFLIWIIGVISFILYFVSKYLSFKKSIELLTEIDKDEILFAFEDVKRAMKINRSIPIMEYNGIPMLVGLFKPVLLIPKDHNYTDLRDLFYHELTHHKHFDIVINWIAILLRCLFWFNPMIWYAFKTMQDDCELACDYRVIKEMDIPNRKCYASTLLKYATLHMTSTDATPILGVPSMADSASEIKKRIWHISSFKKYSAASTALAVVLVLILSITCLTTINTQAALVDSIQKEGVTNSQITPNTNQNQLVPNDSQSQSAPANNPQNSWSNYSNDYNKSPNRSWNNCGW